MGLKSTERQKERYTYQDYAKWDGRWELINRVPYSIAPASSFVHQSIVGELYVALRSCFREKGCAVVMAPFDVRLDERRTMNRRSMWCSQTSLSFAFKL
ncbi:hypothetical protein LG52_1595 [Geobacillus kaustophilus]|uniref:Restriction endonuclease domain-containing protein n=1 Tax=Geobacillus kaustophilus TaxID=1462 RepID=A0A0D8BXI0_GEOKU|nr:hypothetical protein LG52_1595 [Geobacillus kaustophilus]